MGTRHGSGERRREDLAGGSRGESPASKLADTSAVDREVERASRVSVVERRDACVQEEITHKHEWLVLELRRVSFGHGRERRRGHAADRVIGTSVEHACERLCVIVFEAPDDAVRVAGRLRCS